MTKFIFSIILSVAGGVALAQNSEQPQAIRLVAWKPTPQHATFILPAIGSETDTAAVSNFLSSTATHADLKSLLPLNGIKIESLIATPLKVRRQKAALLLANEAKDFTASPMRVFKFMKPLADVDVEVFVLPVGAAYRLNPEQRKEFYKKIGLQFPMVVAMGGDDVDPALYRRENMYAQNLNTTRDILEYEFLKYYIENFVMIDLGLKGFVLGVCRGHQLTASVMGSSLIQDIPVQIGGREKHGNNDHNIRMFYTKNNLMRSFAGLNVDKDLYLKVNSLHHQAVNPTTLIHSPQLQIAATSEDGIVEALEFKNGGGLLMQFHPEYMKDKVGERILQGAFKHALSRQPSCKSALQKKPKSA